ncbi:MAG: hypothetical protein M1814_004956 [Vezdaea aestivalis]|nr:MAG: hypothetical protein M1814_004956 [Vezdaea aestivalis]
MNWTGGNLYRHSRNHTGPLTAAQRRYFAKASGAVRSKVGPSKERPDQAAIQDIVPDGPENYDPRQSPGLNTAPGLTAAEKVRPSRYGHIRSLEDVQADISLRGAQIPRFNESSVHQSKEPNGMLPEGAVNVEDNVSSERAKLLALDAWVGPPLIEPAKFFFSDLDDKSTFGRRRALTSRRAGVLEIGRPSNHFQLPVIQSFGTANFNELERPRVYIGSQSHHGSRLYGRQAESDGPTAPAVECTHRFRNELYEDEDVSNLGIQRCASVSPATALSRSDLIMKHRLANDDILRTPIMAAPRRKRRKIDTSYPMFDGVFYHPEDLGSSNCTDFATSIARCPDCPNAPLNRDMLDRNAEIEAHRTIRHGDLSKHEEADNDDLQATMAAKFWASETDHFCSLSGYLETHSSGVTIGSDVNLRRAQIVAELERKDSSIKRETSILESSPSPRGRSTLNSFHSSIGPESANGSLASSSFDSPRNPIELIPRIDPEANRSSLPPVQSDARQNSPKELTAQESVARDSQNIFRPAAEDIDSIEKLQKPESATCIRNAPTGSKNDDDFWRQFVFGDHIDLDSHNESTRKLPLG